MESCSTYKKIYKTQKIKKKKNKFNVKAKTDFYKVMSIKIYEEMIT